MSEILNITLTNQTNYVQRFKINHTFKTFLEAFGGIFKEKWILDIGYN